jgi:FkbM family methyltransferase
MHVGYVAASGEFFGKNIVAQFSELFRFSMIRETYRRLLRHPSLRVVLRKSRARLQSVAGYSDPYYDLATITTSSNARLFLDIGCHHGDTALRLIESGVRCPIAAFDPLKDNLLRAKELMSNSSQVTYYECALSDEDGRARFYLNRNEQTSSLLMNDKGNECSFCEDTAPEGTCEVLTRKLDSWAREHNVRGPCVVKCDTQGAEGFVIRGGKSFIRDHCAAFYGEVMLGDMYQGQTSFEEMRLLLEKDCGLVLRNIYPCLHDDAGRAVQMDALWIKPELLRV